MRRKAALAVVLATVALGMAGCGRSPGTRAVTGGLIGAGGGAIIGGALGAPLAGAAVGAGAGAVTGAATAR